MNRSIIATESQLAPFLGPLGCRIIPRADFAQEPLGIIPSLIGSELAECSESQAPSAAGTAAHAIVQDENFAPRRRHPERPLGRISTMGTTSR